MTHPWRPSLPPSHQQPRWPNLCALAVINQRPQQTAVKKTKGQQTLLTFSKYLFLCNSQNNKKRRHPIWLWLPLGLRPLITTNSYNKMSHFLKFKFKKCITFIKWYLYRFNTICYSKGEKNSAKSVTYHHLWSLVSIYTKIKLNFKKISELQVWRRLKS